MNQPLAEPAVLAEPKVDTARRYLCRHIHTLGHRCASPALTGAELCYHHTRARRQAPMAGNTGTYSMPRIDDRTAIQLALYDLLSRIAGGDIDLRRAAILLKGLQTASLNLSRRIPPSPADPAAADPATRDTAASDPAVSDPASAPPQPEQVEQFTHHPHLGDLAPIQQIPTQAEAAAAAAAATAATQAAAAQAASAPKPEVPLFSGIFAINKPTPSAQSRAAEAAEAEIYAAHLNLCHSDPEPAEGEEPLYFVSAVAPLTENFAAAPQSDPMSPTATDILKVCAATHRPAEPKGSDASDAAAPDSVLLQLSSR